MNFAELEDAAGKLLDEQKRLRDIEAELLILSQEITQDPKRNEKDQAFYALIGMDWSDPGHKDRAETLRKDRESVKKSVAEAEARLFRRLGTEPLVVPLDPVPTRAGEEFHFKFRAGVSFPNTVEELSLSLGIPAPLKIGEVTIHPDMVAVAESDEFFAKKKIVDAFEDIRKAVKRKQA